ncbi:MAG: hypothetical protein AAFR17_13655 [Pseudomonadota bacterium]
MYRLAVAFAALMLTIAAVSSVRAEETRVSYPFMAGSLHAGGIDMVYYIDPSDAVIADPYARYDVYVTFAAEAGPVRHVLHMEDRDAREVMHRGSTYRFWRAATRVYAAVDTIPLAQAE